MHRSDLTVMLVSVEHDGGVSQNKDHTSVSEEI